MSYETTEKVRKTLAKRYAAEKRFKFLGMGAICVGVLALVFLFTDIISKGYPAFYEHYIKLEVNYDLDTLGLEAEELANPDELAYGDFQGLIRNSLRDKFSGVTDRAERRELYSMVSTGAGYRLRDEIANDNGLAGKTESLWLLADDDVDLFIKSGYNASKGTRLSEAQQAWVKQLRDEGLIKSGFNKSLFTSGDSREPEQAGIWGALMGSFFTMLVTLSLSFPIGVAAAIYLEEFAPKNAFTDFIEVNINNLAAVPSIIFGLLGLAIFISMFGMPRSVPLVGGIVLTLMTLPTIIISSRAAIKSVPPSIREAATGLGASKMQVVLQHVLPLAMPGMLTGAIIGMAQALGETAPLLMIGMIAFIVDVPGGPLDPATVMPVQIYLWADSPEQGFVALTSAAIMVLLGFLILMNTLAVLLRKRLERRW